MSKQFEDLSNQEKAEVSRLNQFQQQLEMLSQQKISLEGQVKELEYAFKELTDAGETAVVYKSIGGILIKSEQKKLLDETKEKKETTEMRVKSLGSQEERMKKQFEELRSKVEGILGKK